jgi:hypothetical protein
MQVSLKKMCQTFIHVGNFKIAGKKVKAFLEVVTFKVSKPIDFWRMTMENSRRSSKRGDEISMRSVSFSYW